jgi:hypothetical protein
MKRVWFPAGGTTAADEAISGAITCFVTTLRNGEVGAAPRSTALVAGRVEACRTRAGVDVSAEPTQRCVV